MYMSRVWLDTHKEETAKAFISLSQFHGATENAFSDERQHPLWSLNRLHGDYYILMVSSDKPDLSHMQEQFGCENRMPEIKPYDPLLEKIQKEQKWRFRIATNPVRSDSCKRRHSICGEENRMAWLIQQGAKHGFFIDENQFMITGEQDHEFKKWNPDSKNSFTIMFHETDFEGILCVTDTELFKQALCKGIGHEKAYGMGMLTIA